MTDPLEDVLQRYCGSIVYQQEMEDQEPLLGMAAEAFEMFGTQQIRGADRRTIVPVIPVWFHVLWHDPRDNISDDQIYTQIDVWNECMNALNPDRLTVTPEPFRPLIGNPMMQFTLAGITRTYTAKTEFSMFDDGAKFASSGGHDVVTPGTHLNYWVIPKLTENFAGYCTFPYGPASVDGMVMIHELTGTIGTANHANFDKGRTAVHELGHYFNLHHIWGDDGGACNGSDFVADTPNQAIDNHGSPTFPHITCNNGPNGDLFVNYMDYTWDTVTVMFTVGQCTRMDLALKNGRPLMDDVVATGPPTKYYNPAPVTPPAPAPQTNKGGLGRPPVIPPSIGKPPPFPPRRFV